MWSPSIADLIWTCVLKNTTQRYSTCLEKSSGVPGPTLPRHFLELTLHLQPFYWYQYVPYCMSSNPRDHDLRIRYMYYGGPLTKLLTALKVNRQTTWLAASATAAQSIPAVGFLCCL